MKAGKKGRSPIWHMPKFRDERVPPTGRPIMK